jgi:hypothetical protein
MLQNIRTGAAFFRHADGLFSDSPAHAPWLASHLSPIKETVMDNPNASSSSEKSQKPQSGKENKPLAKGQKADLSEDEKSVDSQSEFSRIEKLRNEEE